MGVDLWTDPLVSWIGAGGVLAYIVHIHRQRSRSAVETKVLFLLYCLMALFLIRGFYWLTDDVRLQVPAFVPATLLPLAITLFVEALLRRHAGPALKIFVAVGTLLVFWLNILNPISREDLFVVYKIFMLVTFAWLGKLLITRKRGALSAMENRFVDGITAALACTFVLALTDLQIRPDWLHFRIGSIGGLIFVYVCLRLDNAGGSRLAVPAEIAGLLARSLVITLAFALIMGSVPVDAYVAAFIVSVALVLLVAILERVRESRLWNHRASFFQWLINARTATLDEFIESLHQLPLAAEHIVLRDEQLGGYDVALVQRAFDEGPPVATLGTLRAELAKDGENAGVIEQLVALLENHAMTHATLLSTAPRVMLLLNLPELAGAHNPVLEVRLLQKFGRLVRSS